MVRKASLERVTKETDIKVNINIDGKNNYKINSGHRVFGSYVRTTF